MRAGLRAEIGEGIWELAIFLINFVHVNQLPEGGLAAAAQRQRFLYLKFFGAIYQRDRVPADRPADHLRDELRQGRARHSRCEQPFLGRSRSEECQHKRYG